VCNGSMASLSVFSSYSKIGLLQHTVYSTIQQPGKP
jgi:hypothetical protein